MDLSYSEEYEKFRSQVRTFLEAHWPPKDSETSREDQTARFRQQAIEAGYLARSIPKKYGGSEQEADVLKAAVIREEFRRVRAPGEVAGIGPGMLVPTLLDRGEEWQKEKFVAPTMRGEIVWCQGYSEPGSGSDLASLQTKGELVGDEWVINGQKIWTSGAQHADYMFCLTRTEPEAQKHAGISYLLIDMHQPGIDVRPLKQMNGSADFNEVFLTDVRTPKDWIVGKRGEGWLVSRTTLKHERNMIGNAEQSALMFAGLVDLARKTQRNGRSALQDPSVRQHLVEIEGRIKAHQYSGHRQLTKAAKNQDPGIIQLMNKLNSTNIGHAVAKLSIELLEDDSLLEPGSRLPDSELDLSGWMNQYMWSLGIAVAGGTANIQRNVIGERGLGLPRDAAVQRS
ncbi:MAG: acyl-CoA dehydrogenase [bacterium]|nr:acyl-CoA dehydrogenase [bacterium]